MQASKAIEFTVSIPNHAGALADLMAKLASRQINIEAFMLYTSFIMNIPNMPLVAGVCKMVATDSAAARTALQGFGLNFREEQVILLTLADHPGALARELGILAEAGLEIKDAYATMPRDGASGTIVMAVSDIDKAFAVLSLARP